MARIFYSMAGEGRGHATRVRALVEALRSEHEIVLFAPDDAYRLLAPLYMGTEVEVQEIPGLGFRYREHRLDFAGTIGAAFWYFAGLPGLIDRLAARIREDKPDLVLTDFEPALPAAARRCKVPFISLDHQHFLVVNDLSSLPLWLRMQAFWMSLVVRAYYWGQSRTIVSSFYSPPVRPGFANVTTLGVLLRPEILQQPVSRGRHLVAYLRRQVPEPILDTLAHCGREVRLYGLGRRPARGGIQFCPISETGFIEDLASCDALISTAGNQLVGEAFYLRKPVYAIPEAKNFEQEINAHFLKASGGGDWARIREFTPQRLAAFLQQVERYRANLEFLEADGTEVARAAIEATLSQLPTEPYSQTI